MINQPCESGACISVDQYETVDGILVRIRSTITGTVCQATAAEFADFRDRIKAGAFDHIGRNVEMPT